MVIVFACVTPQGAVIPDAFFGITIASGAEIISRNAEEPHDRNNDCYRIGACTGRGKNLQESTGFSRSVSLRPDLQTGGLTKSQAQATV